MLRYKRVAVIGAIIIGVFGVSMLLVSRAATPTASSEAEAGAVSSQVATVNDSSASDGQAVRFTQPAVSQSPPAIGTASAPANYTLFWSDEFSGSSIDQAKWNIYNNSNYGSGGSSDMCYMAANSTVSNGQLHLRAQKQTVNCGGTNPDTGNNTYYVTSGAITTRSLNGNGQKFGYSKGYMEASVRLPLGNPYWGAVWLVGGSGAPGWPEYGEFDVMEQLGTYPDAIIQTLHYSCGGSHCQTSGNNLLNLKTFDPSSSTSNRGTALTTTNAATFNGASTSVFVRYGFLWDDNSITWYTNGRPTRTFDGTNVYIYTTDTSGKILTKTKTNKVYGAVSPSSWAQVLNYNHTILLNLAYGGDVPVNNGYSGNETSSGYNDGNFAGNIPASMDIDYIRVYQ